MSWRLNPRDLSGMWSLIPSEERAVAEALNTLKFTHGTRSSVSLTLDEFKASLLDRGRVWAGLEADRLESPEPVQPQITKGRQLPRRLRDVLELIPHEYAIVDIGTDHAYLPIAALLLGVSPVAVGIDLALAPLQQARHHALRVELAGTLALWRGDGVAPLLTPSPAAEAILMWSDEAGARWRERQMQGAVAVTICGVGGHTAAYKIAELPAWVSVVAVQANTAPNQVINALSHWVHAAPSRGVARGDQERGVTVKTTLTRGRLFVTLHARRDPQGHHLDLSAARDPHLDLWRWLMLSRGAHDIAVTPLERQRPAQKDALNDAVFAWCAMVSELD